MAENQEIIEARLCAYIDDELDAEGRAEIEKHLTSNPQHRRLIQELRRTSELVRGLPRESAPPELLEAFNGQLERSVLLEGAGDNPVVAGQIHRWPQTLAMAAIVLMTVGLGVVVYFALPTIGRQPHFQVASNSARSRPTTLPQDKEAFLADRDGEELAQVAKRRDSLALRSRVLASSDADNLTLDQDLAKAPTTVKLAQAGEDPVIRRFADSFRVAKPAAEPVVLLVDAVDPRGARESLETYLTVNNIPWQPPAMVSDSRLELKADTDAQKSKAAVNEIATNTAPAGSAEAADAAAKDLFRKDAADLHAAGEGRGIAAPAPEAAVAKAASQPALVGAGEPQQNAAVLQKAAMAPAVTESSKPEVGERAAAGAKEATAPAETMYVVCKLTPQQAQALGATLAADGARITREPVSRTAVDEKLIERGALTPATTQPAIQSLRRESFFADGPATRPTAGNVEQELADAAATVAPAAPAPQSPAPAASAAKGATPTSAPAPEAVATLDPATQPSGAVGGESEKVDRLAAEADKPSLAASAVGQQLIDVLVVVRKAELPVTSVPAAAPPTATPLNFGAETTPRPASAPATTQPAASPPTTNPSPDAPTD